MFGDMMKKNYITTIILLTVLMLTACDKVSPTGVLIASSDVDDRVKMSHEYYQIHKREYNVLVGSVMGGLQRGNFNISNLGPRKKF